MDTVRWTRCLGLLVFACVLLLTLTGCGDSSDTLPSQARFRLRPSTPSEPVRLEFTGAAAVAEAEALLQSGEMRWAVGGIRAGDGGFNAPWHWHLDPATV